MQRPAHSRDESFHAGVDSCLPGHILIRRKPADSIHESDDAQAIHQFLTLPMEYQELVYPYENWLYPN